MQNEKGRIYLLMGYLGSGKTTFIRNLLANKQGIKYAVIQNEFSQGQMGIEQPLIMDQSGVPFSQFLQLPNGCICCSAKNDLIASVQYIISNTDVRNVVVETNGLADPAESIKQFWFDEEWKINAQLHSIISIISALKFPTISDEQLLKKQIAFANKVLITFLDKAPSEQVQQLEALIKEENQEVHIAKSDSYNVVEFLSGNSMFELDSLKRQKIEANKGHHHHGIDSIFLTGSPICEDKMSFQIKVGTLLWQSGLKVMRIKGAICLKDSPNIYELQGVDDLFELKPTNTSKEKFENQTRILIIGQNLEAQKLRQILQLTQ